MKLLMVMNVNGKEAKVYGTAKNDIVNPVQVNIADASHTFDNIIKFWQFLLPMHVTDIRSIR